MCVCVCVRVCMCFCVFQKWHFMKKLTGLQFQEKRKLNVVSWSSSVWLLLMQI